MMPIELLNHAVEKGLNALSITDHDSIDAYNSETLTTAKELGLELISGVEFSTVLNQVSVHLLGYDFSLDNKEINAFCEMHKMRRQKRYRAILELLNKHGMPINEEELLRRVAKSAPERLNLTIGRPHIAQMMVHMGYVETLQEAFKKYLGDGCSCYVQGEYVTPEATIDIIHKAGGVAVIAHPHLVKESSVLLKLLEMNFDGIECYYSRFPPKDHERWLQIANHRNWLITGGSDFHGTVKPLIPLGCSWINDTHLRRLLDRDLRRTT
jgi:predicted metal-dependent phosphoesterase TrpH